MGLIKVRFKWTELIRVSKTRSTFKKVTTEVAHFTFGEIRQIHACNYKGIGNVRRGYAYLMDDWGHSSMKLGLHAIKEKLEARAVVYEVELNIAWLRFSPVVKTKREQLAFSEEVNAYGSLD